MQVNCTVYQIHEDILTSRSETFQGLLQLPRNGIRQEEGLSEEDPIIVPGVTTREFDTLLDFLYGQDL